MKRTVKTLWINEGKGFSIALFLLSAPSGRMFYEVDGHYVARKGSIKVLLFDLRWLQAVQ